MIIFIASIITTFVGMCLGQAIGQAEVFVYFGGILGFSLPYAIVLQKMFKTICMKDWDRID